MAKTKRDSGRNRQGARTVLPTQSAPKGPLPRKDRTTKENQFTKTSIKK